MMSMILLRMSKCVVGNGMYEFFEQTFFNGYVSVGYPWKGLRFIMKKVPGGFW